MSLEAGENQAELRQKLLEAAELGRGVVAESQQRQQQSLIPYLKPEAFNPKDVAALKGREQISSQDIIEAERASLTLALQAADQIARVELPRRPAGRALRPQAIQAEVDSFTRLDGILGKSFFRAKKMIEEGRANELIQEARKVIAQAEQTTPDKIEASDQEILQWVENTIQTAGQRIQGHLTRAQKLL